MPRKEVLFEFKKENNTVKDTLVEARIRGVSLRNANLDGADISGADLHGIDLQGASLYNANLRGANLCGANLYGADLHKANLCWVNLSEANLRGANLHGADFSEANLYEANLRGADFSEVNLIGANLHGVKNAEEALAQTLIVPDGDIIGWKKCCNGVLAKLLIPKDAKRSSATGRKCRAEYVEVLELINLSNKRKKVSVGISDYDNSVEYRVGKTVECDEWDEDRFKECSNGIHFFITRIEAENYIL